MRHPTDGEWLDMWHKLLRGESLPIEAQLYLVERQLPYMHSGNGMDVFEAARAHPYDGWAFKQKQAV